MKKFFSIMLMILLLSIVMSSCGSSKDVSTANNSGRVKVQKTECQLMAEEKPALRDWGESTHPRESYAAMYAETVARGKFARKISSCIMTASNEQTAGIQKFVGDGETSKGVNEAAVYQDAFNQQIAEQSLSNLVTINSEAFLRNDGQYQVYVCLEWRGSVEELASQITNVYQKGQQLSDENHAKNYNYDQFKAALEKELMNWCGE